MSELVDGLVKLARDHPWVKSVRIVSHDETPAGSLELKIRCRLVKDYQLQIWLHQADDSQDYAYQFFADQPILRWDNAPHFPHIATAPHHFHTEHNKVTESPLTGKSLQDVRKVLAEIETWIAERETNAKE